MSDRVPAFYVLDEACNVVAVADEDEWKKWCAANLERCVIGRTFFSHYYVSTAFLAHDAAFGTAPELQLFETAVFANYDARPEKALELVHYATFAAAAAGHKAVVEKYYKRLIN